MEGENTQQYNQGALDSVPFRIMLVISVTLITSAVHRSFRLRAVCPGKTRLHPPKVVLGGQERGRVIRDGSIQYYRSLILFPPPTIWCLFLRSAKAFTIVESNLPLRLKHIPLSEMPSDIRSFFGGGAGAGPVRPAPNKETVCITLHGITHVISFYVRC